MEFVVCGEEWRAGFSRGPTAMKQRELYQWRPGTWAEDSPWQITPQHFADSGRHCGQLPVPEATRGEYKGGLLRNLSCRCSISCWSLVALLRRDSSEDLHPAVSVRAEDAERTFNLPASSRPTTLDSYCSTVSPRLTPRVLLPAFAPLTVRFDLV